MCDFKPGDEVVCVATCPDYALSDMPPPVVGASYIVAEVKPCTTSHHRRKVFGIRVAELPSSPSGCMYFADHFRKVQRRDLAAWLETATDFEEPKRAPARAA